MLSLVNEISFQMLSLVNEKVSYALYESFQFMCLLVCRWVPIKGNDWFWIRHFIKVGMHVIVEITVLLRQIFLSH